MRGLYLISSGTSSRLAVLGSSALSPYDAVSHVDLKIDRNSDSTSVRCDGIEVLTCERVQIERTSEAIDLSVFESWDEAEPFISARSFNFVYDSDDRSMRVVQGVLKGWNPTPVVVSQFDSAQLGDHESAHRGMSISFQVTEVDYLLRLGRLDQ